VSSALVTRKTSTVNGLRMPNKYERLNKVEAYMNVDEITDNNF